MFVCDQTDDIPKRTASGILVVRLKANERTLFSCWSPKFWGVWLHWNPKTRRSEPHIAEPAPCSSCRRNLPLKWRGYLFGYNAMRQCACFMEFTPNAANTIKESVNGMSLRGQRFNLARTAADNGRLLVTLLAPVSDEHAMPEDKSPAESLQTLWGFEVYLPPSKTVSSYVDNETF